MSEQSKMVMRKVKYLGAGRCDICETVRAECIEIPLGMFGVFCGCLCKACLKHTLSLFGRDVADD